jgi:hypothetical protein
MTELLTAEEISILSRLEEDLITAYRDASTTPENRADAEIIRRGIRDRLKPYERQSVLVGGIIQKTITATKTQQAQIKGLVGALERITKSELPPEKVFDYEGNDNTDLIAQYEMGEALGYHYQAMEAKKALSTLPAEFLEKERKREAVIRAAKKWFHEVGQQSCEELGQACSVLEQSVEALEASPSSTEKED